MAEAATNKPDEQAILETTRRVADHVLGPNATATDRSDRPNRANFSALAEAGLLGLAIPKEYGGLNASGAVQREYTEILASYCGVTMFTQAQHHGPCRMIANGPNDALKNQLLPDLAAGKSMCGVSFAHLRRPGPSVLQAVPEEGGYRLYGTAPWVTGWGLMNQFVFGAALPDERHVYLWSPAARADFPDVFADLAPANGDWGTLTATDPLPLCAMNASATVELTLNGWFVPQAHWLFESDREKMRQQDRNGVLGPTPQTLGCTVASVRLLCETAEKRHIRSVEEAAASFGSELHDAKTRVLELMERTNEPEFFTEGIAVRAWCIDLAMRAAHAAVASASGAANLATHPAQRLLREALFYTVQAQTQDVLAETLHRLQKRI